MKYFTMGTYVGGHKAPHRREWSSQGSLGIEGGLFGLALALTLVHWQSLGHVCWLLGSVMGCGGVLWVLDLLSQACRPLGLGSNLSSASTLPCGVPTSCLCVLTHPLGASSKLGRVLPALSLLILLTASTSLLALPPTAITNLSTSSEYYLSILLAILSFSTFSMM